MTDPRDPGASATPYREAAPHAPTSVVRYAVRSPIVVVLSRVTAAVVILIAGCVAVAQLSGPVMQWAGLAILALAAVSFVVWLVVFTGDVHVEVDYGAGIVLLRRMRWPLRPRVRTFPIARVMDAIVDCKDDGDENGFAVYMVFLLIEGGPAVPLVEGTTWGRGEKRHDETAAAIRALLPRHTEE